MAYFTDSFQSQLDDLLHRICIKLQISKSQYESAETHYKAVANWLEKGNNLLSGADVDIYPQGSLRLGTTVRPLASQEYDLDLVCEIDLDWCRTDPLKVLGAVEKRLRENKSYAKMIERKNRCIRLTYAQQFHMDILPACPADPLEEDGNLKVPDRRAQSWKDSNPKGYAEWFEERSIPLGSLVVKAEVEPLPDQESVEQKPPLKRVVQLIKRHRDIYFESKPDLAPISVVLTTLAGMNYGGEASVNESMLHVLQGILGSIRSARGRLKVLNPTNPAEDLSERWDSVGTLYPAFVDFIDTFHSRWRKINELRGLELADRLKQMFGEAVTTEAIEEQVKAIEKARQAGMLRITTGSSGVGVLTGAKGSHALPVKDNTFYGEP